MIRFYPESNSGGSQEDDASESLEDKENEDADDSQEESGKDEVDARVRKANREAQEYRKKLRQTEERLNSLEAANLSDQERLQRENDTLKQENESLQSKVRDQSLEVRVANLVGKFKIADLESVLLHMKRRVEFDDEGEPVDVEQSLKALIRDKPHLASANSGNGGGGNAERGSRSNDEDLEKLPLAQRSMERLRRAHSKS